MQFAGELSNVKLPNLLQLIGNGGLTGKVTISNETKKALICFEKGQIVHAENEMKRGRDALMELFLWDRGSFSFLEGDSGGMPRSLDTTADSDTMEALMRDGMRYAEQKTFLDRHSVRDNTVLKPRVGIEQSSEPDVRVLLGILDGQLRLNQAVEKAKLTERGATETVYKLVSQGLVEVLDLPVPSKTESISLPDWVSARFKQYNHDL